MCEWEVGRRATECATKEGGGGDRGTRGKVTEQCNLRLCLVDAVQTMREHAMPQAGK